MKNKLGKAIGFISGAGGFLLLFKLLFIANVPPSDELAPGIVVISAIAFGVIMAYVGGYVQGIVLNKK
jgi:hypothetical protein